MTQMHENIVGIDAAIFMHPTTWKASGHVDNFSDPMIDNKDSKKRYRVDHLDRRLCRNAGEEESGKAMHCRRWKHCCGRRFRRTEKADRRQEDKVRDQRYLQLDRCPAVQPDVLVLNLVRWPAEGGG